MAKTGSTGSRSKASINKFLEKARQKAGRQPGLSDLTETMPMGVPPSVAPTVFVPMTPLPDISQICGKPTQTIPVPIAPTPLPPTNLGSPAKKGPPPVETIMVKAKCGHEVAFDHYAKDKYRAERRSKITDRKCGACRAVENEARMKADQERKIANSPAKLNEQRIKKAKARHKKKLDKIVNELKLPPGKANKGKVFGRLPHGANFNVTWDAEKQEWSGTPGLTVPNFHGEDRVFNAQCSALFWVIPQMDLKFRQWWATNHPEEERAERDRIRAEWEAKRARAEEQEKPAEQVDEKQGTDLTQTIE